MAIPGERVILGLVLAASTLFAQAQPSAREARAPVLQPEAEQLLALANQARAAAGAAPLKWDAALAAAARRHCLRMAAEGPISHRYGGELDLSERAGEAGAHFSLIEENVAVGPNPSSIHQGWMQSPGHRTNMLNPEVDRVGMAAVASRGVIYAVADYSRAVQNLSHAQIEEAIAGLVRARRVALLGDSTAARAACGMDRGFPKSLSGQEPRFVMRWQDADLTHLPAALVDRLRSGEFTQAAIGSCPPRNVEGSFTLFRVAVLLY